jgi:hypothetical protein
MSLADLIYQQISVFYEIVKHSDVTVLLRTVYYTEQYSTACGPAAYSILYVRSPYEQKVPTIHTHPRCSKVFLEYSSRLLSSTPPLRTASLDFLHLSLVLCVTWIDCNQRLVSRRHAMRTQHEVIAKKTEVKRIQSVERGRIQILDPRTEFLLASAYGASNYKSCKAIPA